MAKKKGWPKSVTPFCSICKTEASEIPYLKLYSDEFSEKDWREYCNLVSESPECSSLTLYIAGVTADFA